MEVAQVKACVFLLENNFLSKETRIIKRNESSKLETINGIDKFLSNLNLKNLTK